MPDAIFQVDHEFTGLERSPLLDQPAAAVPHLGGSAVALEKLVVRDDGHTDFRPAETGPQAGHPGPGLGQRLVDFLEQIGQPAGLTGVVAQQENRLPLIFPLLDLGRQLHHIATPQLLPRGPELECTLRDGCPASNPPYLP